MSRSPDLNPSRAAAARRGRPRLSLLLAAVGFLAAGCATVSLNEAPITDKSARRDPAAVAAPSAPPTALSREARDGQYVVQRGDTLYSIALAFGQDYRDLARWNGIADPARLQVGQTLRVQPSTDPANGAVVAAVPVAPVGAADVRPIDAPRAPSSAPPSSTPSVPAPSLPAAATPSPTVPAAAVPPGTATAPSVTTTSPAASPSAALPKAADAPAKEPGSNWSWPAAGKVIEKFDDTRNKGIDIAGTEGEPVMAANDGEVVYVGSSLRGYGNLVIVKHTDDFLSAYAHNRNILVKQGQTVKRGQRIAELGRSDADMPKLHFEVRRQGKPVDPLRYLPPR